jgi:hypothetical protein
VKDSVEVIRSMFLVYLLGKDIRFVKDSVEVIKDIVRYVEKYVQGKTILPIK